MVAGGLVLVAPRFIPIEQGSTLYVVKMLISVAGFILLCLGALLYLYILIRDRPS
jgi:uncharacterized membrane protein